MSTDWLDVPETASVTDSPVAIIPAIPDTLAAQNAKIVSVWAALTPQQRTIIQSLQLHNFNVVEALRAISMTPFKLDKTTYYRWLRRDDDFASAVHLLKMQAVAEIDSHRPLLRLNEIAEDALELKDVFFKGEPTGEKRRDYAAALKATELQMKNKKLLGDTEDKGGFGGRNITLSVQVVMPGGELKDARRAEGVVIDAPVIEVLP